MKFRTAILTFLVILAAAAARSAETLTLTQDGKTVPIFRRGKWAF